MKKDPEEIEKSQLEAKKKWIEMKEKGLFNSYRINHLPVQEFATIFPGFGIAVLADGKEVMVPLISSTMINSYFGCHMQPGDYKYERELKSLDHFANLGPLKEELECKKRIFGRLVPEMDKVWRCPFAFDYQREHFPLNGIFDSSGPS